MLKPTAADPATAALQKNVSEARLRKACTEFESIFITYMLKTMRAAVAEDGALGNSNERQIIQSMFDENLALGIAKDGGIGLAEILAQHLKAQ
ncbi:MAG: rod-binding protein [Pseudomonadota bacterium]